VNGADIMRPGITEIDDRVKEDGIVVIVDENHGKPLAVGVSKMSAEALRSASSGKVIKSIHHINDDLWIFGKS
jgi:predicted RNA-binding protein (TIGR00451 family)